MKLSVYIYIILLITVCSCSYLPVEPNLQDKIDFEETTEYIKLSSIDQTSNKALIFLPGGLVDPHAYISLMQKIAQEGTTVFILKFSANLAILELSKPLKIKDEMSDIKEWYISGHSLGGISAQAAVNKNPDSFKGLIFLGVYPAETYSIADWDKNVLSIYAENDQLSTMEEIEANKHFLPSDINIDELSDIDNLMLNKPATMYYLIKGGNHSQFGDYGFQKGDGISTISTEEQHIQISTAITKFINWNEN